VTIDQRMAAKRRAKNGGRERQDRVVGAVPGDEVLAVRTLGAAKRTKACILCSSRRTACTRARRATTSGSPDPDVVALRARVQAVRRDEHKMHAFVRFRRTEGPDGEHFIAWHRPDHPILPLAAPVLRAPLRRHALVDRHARRLGPLGRPRLRFGPGAARHTAPAPDELEDLFRTYYRNIFNPARLNLRAMRAEMPRKHWASLPEASIIGELTREARAAHPGHARSAGLGRRRHLPAVRTYPCCARPPAPAAPASCAATPRRPCSARARPARG
jgi:hypothetical protein